MSKNFLFATSTLVGAIVGAGIFGLPFAVARSGFAIGVLYIVAFGVVLMLINLAYGEVVLRTPGRHRLIGYATTYLGSWVRPVIVFSTVVNLQGGLLAYLILGGQFAHFLLHPIVGGTAAFWSLTFFAVGALVIWRGLRLVGPLELLLDLLFIGALFALAVSVLPFVRLEHLAVVSAAPGAVLLPFGVTLFALAGWIVVPELRDFFPHGAGRLRLAIVVGSLIPVLLALLFVTAVVGVTGPLTTPEALGGLQKLLGAPVLIIGSLFGLGAIITSLFIFGLGAKHLFHYDLGLPMPLAWVLAVAPAPLLYLAGATNFITVIAISGTVSTFLEGSAILASYRRALAAGERRPEYELHLSFPVTALVVLLFAAGLVAHFWFVGV
ncbi:MAG: aromatic amino acid transport family protein [bacterium]|nr:aromatic amino acid transport family protein [bacterium]MDZ4296528.1 aromatic amino acid transport family protein [Patescibacteria group bacterium]